MANEASCNDRPTIRTYGPLVAETIDLIGIVERMPVTVVAVKATHEDAGRLDFALRGAAYHVAGIDYGEMVTFELHLAEGNLAPFSSWLAETTSGRCVAQVVGINYVEVPVGKEAK